MSLDKVAKKIDKALEKELKNIVKEKSRDGSLITINGRKIVPLRKWKSLSKELNDYEILRYVPTSFVRPGLVLKDTLDHKIEKERNEWYKDYTTVLSYRRDPKYGGVVCQKCILHPMYNVGSNAMIRIITKGLQMEPSVIPCNVVNFFECPNKKIADDSRMADYGTCARIVYARLEFARNGSRGNLETFEIDHEKRIVTRYDHEIYSIKEGPIFKSEVETHRTSNIPILDAQDVYDCITSEKSLRMIFEQYEEAISAGRIHIADLRNNADDIEIAQKSRDIIIEIFMQITKNIKLEDVYELANDLIDQKRQERCKNMRESKKIESSQEVRRCEQIKKSDFCSKCKRFATIRCVNCNVWHCFWHWDDHAENQHEMVRCVGSVYYC